MPQIDGTPNNDTLTGTLEDDFIYGQGGNDLIEGLAGSDGLNGGEGNDTIYAGTGSGFLPDFIFDGPGNDTVYGGEDEDAITASPGDDFYDGGEGELYGFDLDSVGYATAAAAGITVDLTLASGQVRSTGPNDAAGIGVDTLVNIEDVYGSSFDDVMIAASTSALNSNLHGYEGNDHLIGGESNDWLSGDAGDDLIEGGAGNDAASYESAQSGVTVSLSISGPQDTGQGLDTLTNIEDLTGSWYDDVLVGNSGANSLAGSLGNDILIGGAGTDLLWGDDGDDLYIVTSASDHTAAEFKDFGFSDDEVRFAATGTAQTLTFYAGDRGIDRIVIGTGTDAVAHTSGTLAHEVDARLLGHGVSVLGNSGANRVLGTGFGDQLDGGAGSDRLLGYAGNDVLDGGKQLDQLLGGLGDDTYIVDAYGDATVELAGEGTDTVIASATVTLRDNVENLQQSGVLGINGTGNALDNVMEGNVATNRLFGLEGSDTLVGNEGNDQLNGGAGNDVLIGGAGNDYYFVDSAADTVTELAGEGRDTVRASASYTLSAEVEWLELQGSANLDGTGNGLANVLKGNDGENALSGLAGNDKLYGGAGSDRVDGGEGNDVLEGGAGSDEFTGGAGLDRFLFRDGDFGGASIATADVIHDFVHAQGDKIRLDAVDANSTLAGNQAFAFLGTGAFTNAAGQLRYEQSGGNTFVQGDIDGDGVADFVIQVDGSVNLVTGDFIL